ncbi:hypothetical protein NV379_25555 [Paenibacillus sp. N1-5-1-14]|uniref:hypothetical protein n=1 Tax=Paenibacillus radicibacter TaxID=2972488 RepID=UPI002158FFF8|nr:hypothetical protein [Paenibacillus radicibacter]MCR8645993.1 hypothetical protein [Paenibacillus radicibacter]
MSLRVLIAGGYGMIGSHAARHLRRINKEVEIIIAGRNPEKGKALAEELGNASVALLDIINVDSSLDAVGDIDLIVAALQDPADKLIHAAIARDIAHIGITKLIGDISPITFAAIQTPLSKPVLLLGHTDAGINMYVAQKASEDFSSIQSIQLASLYDPNDPIGPMNASEFDDNGGMSEQALIRKDGNWEWVKVSDNIRQIHIDGVSLDGVPYQLLDVPSLAGTTRAPNIRVDILQGESIGTKAGQTPSHDVYIEIEGILKTGEEVVRKVVVSNPNGQAHETGLGIAIAIDGVLNLVGKPNSGGIYLPETLVNTDDAIHRIEESGVRIEKNDFIKLKTEFI